MKLHRTLLAAFAALTLSLASPALAQSAPSAAPTGAPADTRPLEPPPGTNVDIMPAGGPAVGTIGGLSIVSVFWRADPVVKAVMVVLLLASLWSWTIIINKWLAFGTLKRRATKFEK
ncbi:MAG TPA: hypothetical protein VJ476_16095, partial [Rhizomicrobium sp.]|nr:hypothetical protein [Rhizomicrobium sp.]